MNQVTTTANQRPRSAHVVIKSRAKRPCFSHRFDLSLLQPGKAELHSPGALVPGIVELVRTVLPLGADSRCTDAQRLLAEGLAALQGARVAHAESILDYANRRFPSDLGLLFAVAVARVLLRNPRAVEPLELLARRLDWRELWLLLVRVRMYFADPSQASQDAATTLSRHVVASDADALALINSVSAASGAAGWCGVDRKGHLLIGGTSIVPRIHIDGVLFKTVTLTGGPGLTQQIRLPKDWHRINSLNVAIEDRPLLGSPVAILQVTAVNGFVEPFEGGVRGWCSMPGDPDHVPDITLSDVNGVAGSITVRADRAVHISGEFPHFTRQRRFWVSPSRLPSGPLKIAGPFGRALYGSPIVPDPSLTRAAREAREAERSWPAQVEGVATSYASGASTDALVVIPVYRGYETTVACVESVLAARCGEHILVISDASPDLGLVARMRELARKGLIGFEQSAVNRGFPGTANLGLRQARGRDVVLLNSDTMVASGWLKRLRRIAHAAPDVGTVTPLSNDATIFSYPSRDGPNELPDRKMLNQIAHLAHRVNAGRSVEVPTGHGFCLYIRGDCLQDTGVFREDIFAQGYGEENDLCLRARALGWRNLAAPGVYVAHLGSQSFGLARTDLQVRNLTTINRLHPGYERMVSVWIADDPLAEGRRRIDIERWQAMRSHRSTVAFVTHDRGGGVGRFLEGRAKSIPNGVLAMVIRPVAGQGCRIDAVGGESFPNLIFRMPEELELVADLLTRVGLARIEIHHFIGHHPMFIDRIRALGVPRSVVVHDYSWFCPRSTLTAADHRYCGEPDDEGCSACIDEHGGTIGETISPRGLRERSARWLTGATEVLAPSQDTARRIAGRFDVPVTVGAWQPEATRITVPAVRCRPGASRRICLAGAIGPEKGFHLLLRCARYVQAHRIPLEFLLVGYSSGDDKLRDAGVQITGPYQEHEAIDLIRRQQCDLAFMPGRLPETWSYVLSHFWSSGLHVVAFDIGAPADRIRDSQAGMLLPLHAPVDRIVQFLLNAEFAEKEVAG